MAEPVSDDEALVRAFVEREQKRIRRISTWVGGLAIGLFVVGFVLGMAVHVWLAIAMLAGGLLLIPALYLSRRALALAGPGSPLVALVSDPKQLRGASLAVSEVGGVRQVILEISLPGRTTGYLMEELSAGAEPSADTNALLAAIRRRMAS